MRALCELARAARKPKYDSQSMLQCRVFKCRSFQVSASSQYPNNIRKKATPQDGFFGPTIQKRINV
jgi:hypothetical protein